ncbi:hypothetical protein ABK040_008322 [Willaertia magna]
MGSSSSCNVKKKEESNPANRLPYVSLSNCASRRNITDEDMLLFNEYKKRKFNDNIEVWDTKLLLPYENEWFNSCKKKLEENGIFSDTLALQNMTIPEKFKYNFFNPAKEWDNIVDYGIFKRDISTKPPQLSVKFVLTELNTSLLKRLERNIAHATNLTKETQFGLFHAALTVGNWYLEFNDDSLINIRHISSTKAVFVIDLFTLTDQITVNEKIGELANFCCKWNGTVKYDQKTNNCQDFVTTVLKEVFNFDLMSHLNTNARDFIENLIQWGRCDMKFKMNNGKTIEFKTHSELDQFCYNLENKDISLSAQDRMLLKAFDRAFWLRKLSGKFPNDSSNEPLCTKSGECNCYFNEHINSSEGCIPNNSVNCKFSSLGSYLPKKPIRLDLR